MSTRNRAPASSKFELPALSVGGFGSLTDGTDIPPPEREPTPPPAPENIPLPASSSPSEVNENGSISTTAGRKPSQISIANTNDTRPGTPNGEGMLSPVMSPISPNRPPSTITRFLSHKSMNKAYNSAAGSRQGSIDSSTAHMPPSRPESSLSFVSAGGTKTRKKRSWWQKLMGKGEENKEISVNDANGTSAQRKRTSTVMEKDEPREVREVQLPPKKKGPPPPTLPALRGVSREGKADGSFGGDDMFINIR